MSRTLYTIAALLLAGPAFAQNAPSTAVIWQDRGDAAALDLSSGPGGKDREPGTEFKFIKESTSGTSPKFDVQDEHGTTWKVKLGEEAKTETAAARLLWAAGYVVDEDYYRATLRVAGLPRLARGQQFVSNGDTVTSARLERDTPDSATTTWSWYDNPFIGTREFNGLRVMMALVNNWDLKEINNTSTGTSGGGAQYSITDLGATFGRTGNMLTRSKGTIKDYADTRFVDRVTATQVDLRMDSRPFFLTIFNVRNYRFRTRMESVAKHIPIADARWIGDLLGRLSTTQIADAFRASGFSSSDVDAYTIVVARRIAALQALGGIDAAVASTAKSDVVDKCRESTCRQVPLRETLTAIRLGSSYARAIFGGFEQGSGIGGGLQLTSGPVIPGVELRAAALTSTERDERYDLEAYLPNIGGSRNHADLWFSYVQRETDFYGIGPRTSEDLKTTFAIERRSYQASLYRDFTDHADGGVFAQVMNTRSALDRAPSSSEILSYGGFLAYDTRDNSVGLTRGVNLFGRIASADAVSNRGAPGSYGWFETELDARGHIPLGSAKTSLSLRSRAQLKTPRGGSEIPYYELSYLGGRQYLRGYHSYRFRDNNVLLVASELQQTVYSMTPTRGIDLFASADTGQVWGGEPFNSRSWESGLGGGLQYRHTRSIAARIEVGRSRERVAIYASLSRGF
jgi:hypothetical protein